MFVVVQYQPMMAVELVENTGCMKIKTKSNRSIKFPLKSIKQSHKICNFLSDVSQNKGKEMSTNEPSSFRHDQV